MGKITGFMEFQRQQETYLSPETRLKNYHEFVQALSDEQAKTEGARCMDCGIPFCNTGCPVNNIIPDWNDLVYRGNYRAALDTSTTRQDALIDDLRGDRTNEAAGLQFRVRNTTSDQTHHQDPGGDEYRGKQRREYDGGRDELELGLVLGGKNRDQNADRCGRRHDDHVGDIAR